MEPLPADFVLETVPANFILTVYECHHRFIFYIKSFSTLVFATKECGDRQLFFSGNNNPALDWFWVSSSYLFQGEASGLNFWDTQFNQAQITEAYTQCTSVSSYVVQ